MVLDDLGSSLKGTLRKIANAVHVDSKLVKEVVRDIQRALLQADVNVKLVLELSKKIEKRALQEKPPAGMSNREHVIHIVYEELVDILSLPNPRDEDKPLIKTVNAGQGNKLRSKQKIKEVASGGDKTFMILIGFTSVGFGLIMASKIEDFEGFQIIMTLVIMPLFFISSAIFPIATNTNLPDFLIKLSFANPLFYMVDGLRGSLTNINNVLHPLVDLAIVLVICIIMMGIGSYLFNKTEI